MTFIKDTLYYKYVSEREGCEFLENSVGFIEYKINGEECFLKNMFIDPSERKTDVVYSMIDGLEKIALENGCKYISANIDLKDKGANRTVRASLKQGFKIERAGNDILLIIKRIKE